ncbi:MAG: LacI family transcriptional regulator [Opitutaceae bacterium]|nr:LacI family transcriptional regulator [Opitutaceae bacterium]
MKDTSPKRNSPVTLADIARAARVSRMTVSLALRNDPRAAAVTRERIRIVARQLGYAPDARLATWMTRIRETTSRSPVTIAWLNASTKQGAWRRYSYLTPYLEGAEKRCTQLGYKLEEFWLQSRGMTSVRLSEILYTRGINGVIIAPPHDGLGLGHVKLDWQHFACVSFEEKVLCAPQIHRVAQDWFYNMTLALKILRRGGYRRIGVYLEGQAERRSSHALRAAVNYFQQRIPSGEHVPLFINKHPGIMRDSLAAWMRQHRPDAVIGQHSELVAAVSAAGFRVPRQVGVVHLALEDDCADWTGVWACKREIGAMAADAVIARMQKHDYGVPEIRSATLVPGRWQPGKTLLLPKARNIDQPITKR